MDTQLLEETLTRGVYNQQQRRRTLSQVRDLVGRYAFNGERFVPPQNGKDGAEGVYQAMLSRVKRYSWESESPTRMLIDLDPVLNHGIAWLATIPEYEPNVQGLKLMIQRKQDEIRGQAVISALSGIN